MSEILGALFKNLVALIGVAAVALILYSVFGASKTSSALNDLTQLQTNTQALYSTQSSFTSLTNDVVVKGGLAPTGMVNGTNLVNPWSGTVTVKVNATDSTRFDVTHTKVPAEACAKMATNTPAIVQISVNGTNKPLPIDAGVAVSSCNDPTNNTMIFTFGH
ncbi:hypothetical protein CBP36_21255 (plasmid) [Acidovorax carolinensis]|uniref:Uncharacterized protein n=1 Tax=Acidovorax carolinensis TaxID=553814 RepID=A0A240UJ20_9BURK|nr:type 4 pilus major pilin [Acidovorax carolinensis]ART61497.1 hypothetical protein CBP36_21255 [Acidovorax carolinensis]